MRRLLHRLFPVLHRFKGCTLRDLRGDIWRGRCCKCGVVDEDAWEWIGTVWQRRPHEAPVAIRRTS
jgi:hypothetical protein